ncbi:hypothetical protein SAMN04489712_10743 [Thermomonospora echinospora]|uniref:Integral membrane protein n=1 Tax=Thermomonospora echinospora TaxID=1992 RepID=A0A1H6BEG2_9ACTN|nr:hypothetical protein [Thermomonospora echinospora]SEG59050.1 hypothetical protein SAMN04489712_10743 [Thermomonospora echinospora]
MRRPEGGKVPTRLGRLRRRLGFDRNGMRRRIDRVQWAVGLALAAVFLMVAPILATWAGTWSYDRGMRGESHERATRRQVVATVTGPGVASGERYLSQTVQATWRAPDGTPRTGRIPAWKDAGQGARRHLWVDGAGHPTSRPRPHSRTVVDAGYAALGATLAAGLPLLGVYGLVRRRCDRVRDALWDEEWSRIDPHRIS